MKRKPCFVLTMLLILMFGISHAQEKSKDLSVLKGSYFGQKPPEKTPEIFADGIVANKYPSFHSSIVFTPDGKECYWQAHLPNDRWAIVWSKVEKGIWTTPVIAPFSQSEFRDDCPFISPDGKRFFFISRRPINKEEKVGKENIWVMNRSDNNWDEPKPLPQCINSLPGIHWQISVDKDYNLFFGICNNIYASEREGDIYCSNYIDGQYTQPEKLEAAIHGQAYNSSPYISPDGSYLIFAREDFKTHKIRIYISFRKKDRTWTEAKDLSSIIEDKPQTCPIITSDGKYFFFLRYINSFCQPFWVDAKIIEELKPDELK